MAFHTLNITLSGGNDQVTTTHTPVRLVGFFNAAGNGAVLIGDKNISATVYATSVAAGADSPRFGPFAGQLPVPARGPAMGSTSRVRWADLHLDWSCSRTVKSSVTLPCAGTFTRNPAIVWAEVWSTKPQP